MNESQNHGAVSPPEPFGPIPSSRQLAWHGLEYYGFLHFTVNTFTNLEWGYGDETPEVFSPSDFNADQIVQSAADGGMNGLILTCKHHDGFCLWPTKYSNHSVKQSGWKNGRGDVVREVSTACAAAGLKFGVYLSPWDRNHEAYATKDYITYYRNQLRELLSEYGSFFEIWFDGANGGDGFYGGARETRSIDPRTYYEWEKTWEIVRELQPEACMFSDAGPDIRWVGNEKGIAGDPCWHRIDADSSAPGDANRELLNSGDRNGRNWLPAECDVSIRPGWFYHTEEDEQVRTPENLMDLYYQSVGRGASLLLNLPPDTRGRIHEHDVASLQEFRRRRDTVFTDNMATGATVTASNVRGASGGLREADTELTNAASDSDRVFTPKRLIDGRRDTYWSTENSVHTAVVEIALREESTCNVVEMREYLPLGQRVEAFEIEMLGVDGWVRFSQGNSIGNRRLTHSSVHQTQRVRIRFSGSVPPAISNIGLYLDRDLA